MFIHFRIFHGYVRRLVTVSHYQRVTFRDATSGSHSLVHVGAIRRRWSKPQTPPCPQRSLQKKNFALWRKNDMKNNFWRYYWSFTGKTGKLKDIDQNWKCGDLVKSCKIILNLVILYDTTSMIMFRDVLSPSEPWATEGFASQGVGYMSPVKKTIVSPITMKSCNHHHLVQKKPGWV